ncbi:Uncharacterised protein [Serratia plymuthica]|nr:Uncharacterised protein [Serratia plymuthica]
MLTCSFLIGCNMMIDMPAVIAAMLAEVAVIAGCWYGLVVLVLSHAPIASAYRRSKAHIDRICGALIVGLGIRQLLR